MMGVQPKEEVILQPSSSEKNTTFHLAHLDGIRGLAALYVVLHHAYLQSAHVIFQPWLQRASGWLYYGHNAVAVFIVLSGYCLMLPIARRGGLSGGIFNFYRRRARRILPPYYAALALSLLAIYLLPILNQKSWTQWDTAIPALNAPSIFSHIFLFHNFSSQLIFKINPPLWSVAVEFQIYLLFPLLLIPLFKRFGIVVTTVASFIVGFSPMILFNRGEGTSPWFLGLFALGMAAAHYNFSLIGKKSTNALFVVCAASTVLLLVLNTFFNEQLNTRLYVTDTICGIATASFLAFYVDSAANNSKPVHLLRRALESRLILLLGTFSYSLYLIHMPILAWFDLSVRQTITSPDARFALLFGVGVPLCIGISYLFYLVVERRFTKTPTKGT